MVRVRLQLVELPHAGLSIRAIAGSFADTDERAIEGRVLALPVPGRLGASFGRGDATAPARAVGGLTWSAWVGARYGPAGR